MEPTLPPERLLTSRELADFLGVSRRALLRWTREGLIPAVTSDSGVVQYCPDEINAWLKSRPITDE